MQPLVPVKAEPAPPKLPQLAVHQRRLVVTKKPHSPAFTVNSRSVFSANNNRVLQEAPLSLLPQQVRTLHPAKFTSYRPPAPAGPPKALSVNPPLRFNFKAQTARTALTNAQAMRLENIFLHQSKTLVGAERDAVAAELGLTSRRLQVWFQNRRAKEQRIRRAETGESTLGGLEALAAAALEKERQKELSMEKSVCSSTESS